MNPARTPPDADGPASGSPAPGQASRPWHGVDHAENFPVGSWLVPAQLRPAVLAIYRFARHADDLADEGDVPTSEREAALQALHAALDEAVSQADVVLDGSDNFATRHAVNRACVRHGKPLVSGAAIRFDGQLAVFDTRQPSSPCYHCLFPDGENVEEVRCSQMGVFAPLTGIIGTMQASEALKLAGQFGTPSVGRLHLLDGRTLHFTEIRVPRDPDCPVCAHRAHQAR